MPWCPNCTEEYIEGVKICGECGAELVDERPEPKPNPDIVPDEEDFDYEFDDDYEEKLLFTADSEFVYVMITEALEKENILFRSQSESEPYTEFIRLYENQPYIGQEVYVRKEDFDRAKEIIDYFESIKEEVSDDENSDDFDE